MRTRLTASRASDRRLPISRRVLMRRSGRREGAAPAAALRTVWRRGLAGLIACLLVVGPANRASAADRPQIFAFNAVIQGALTVVSAAVQGKIRRPADVATRFAAGSIAGAGIYQAKALAGKGRTTSGWLLANVAGSISENAIAGRHPLAQIGYSFATVRFRVSIPRFDPGADAHIHVDVSAYQTLALGVAIAENDRAGLRAGMIAFRRDGPYDSSGDASRGIAIGGTIGIFPGATFDDSEIWAHETVHAIQSLQCDVLEPSISFLTRKPAAESRPKSLVRFSGLKVGLYNFANDALSGSADYEDRWNEIEAYELAQDRQPPRAR
jgi:hypothetical protein